MDQSEIVTGPPCTICGFSSFTAENGFFFCVECGYKSQQLGQQLVEEFDENLPTSGGKRIKLATEKKKSRQITSWEQMNYFLIGYTEKLIAMGAGEELKITVLHLWASYLRRMEVAFFSKVPGEKPKLGVFYKKMDADIIYNRRLKMFRRNSCSSVRSATTKKSSAASSTSENKRAEKRRIKLSKQKLLDAENETFQSQANLDQSLHELSMRSLNASGAGDSCSKSSTTTRASTRSGSARERIRFSRNARREMKQHMGMRGAHIDKHEQDVDDVMECDQLRKQKPTCKHPTPENMTSKTMLTLLGLALNVSESPVQVSDFVRFWREGHLSHAQLVGFLPEEVDPACYRDTVSNFQRVSTISAHELRESIATMARFLQVEPEQPDLHTLCVRYLDDLSLPQDMMAYIQRLLVAFPPIMSMTNRSALPFYEARAMAFIIFVLKFVLGLNDCTELRMSSCAQTVNNHMSRVVDTNKKLPTLFVFTDWCRYVETRRVLLAQVHYPTNRNVNRRYGAGHSAPDPTLFVSHTQCRQQEATQDGAAGSSLHAYPNARWIARVKDVLTSILDSEQRAANANPSMNGNESVKSAWLDFEPSLTPNKSYLERVLQTDFGEKLHIPDYMRSASLCNQSIVPFVDPAVLNSKLLKRNGITLCCKPVPTLKLEKLFSFVTYDKSSADEDESSNDEDDNPPRGASRAQYMRAEFIEENSTNSQRGKKRKASMMHKEQRSGKVPPHIVQRIRAQNAERAATDIRTIGADPSLTKPTERLDLFTSRFDYWVRFFRARNVRSIDSFQEQILPGLADHFRLLLEECARLIETNTYELYNELMLLETYLLYAVDHEESTNECKGVDDRSRTDPDIRTRVSYARKHY